jgi:hypothetical protein
MENLYRFFAVRAQKDAADTNFHSLGIACDDLRLQFIETVYIL